MAIVYPTLRGKDVCALIPELDELNLANWISRGHIAIQSEPPPTGNGHPRTFSLLEFCQIAVMSQLVTDLHLAPSVASAASLAVSGHIAVVFSNALNNDDGELGALASHGAFVLQDGVVTLHLGTAEFVSGTAVMLKCRSILERVNDAADLAMARLKPSLERAETGNQGVRPGLLM